MKHLLLMISFALMVAVVFGLVGRDTLQSRVTYGAKVFGEFLVVGLALAWILYFLPY